MKQVNIFLSPRAKIRLEIILDYLIKNWSIKVKDDFLSKLDKIISLIKNFPEMFPKSNISKNIRKAVITKQITLFYRINNNEIEIITLFDTRQDPKKLKNEIK